MANSTKGAPQEGSVIREALLAKLRAALDPSSRCIPDSGVDEILREFHLAPGDEKEKLRQKDQELVNIIAAFQGFIAVQGYMPQNTALAFQTLAEMFTLVEGILWELKGEEGEPPKPEPPSPPPSP